jgi:sulfate transport system ATP-binding protein
MDHGQIEQVGAPRELYEHPANEFVMSFVGEVNRLGEHFVRPHDMDVLGQPGDGTEEAMVERIVKLGFETRVELALAEGEEIWAQLTGEEAEQLELRENQIVYVRPRHTRKFSSNGSDPATDEYLSEGKGQAT